MPIDDTHQEFTTEMFKFLKKRVIKKKINVIIIITSPSSNSWIKKYLKNNV